MNKFTKADIIRQLDALHTTKGVPVLFHSSLRAIGPVEGGAEALLDALVEHIHRHREGHEHHTDGSIPQGHSANLHYLFVLLEELTIDGIVMISYN